MKIIKSVGLSIIAAMLASSSAYPHDFVVGGIAYDILENGTLSVTHKQGGKWDASKTVNSELCYKGIVEIPKNVVYKGKRYRVSEIGRNAFYSCNQLTSVVIPEGVQTIREEAFSMNKGLSSLHIPSSVAKLEAGFIFFCLNLSDITVSPQSKYYMSKDNCIYNKNMTQLIFVSPKLRTYTFPKSVTSVVDYACYVSSINKLIIPSTLKYIGGKAFGPESAKVVICKKNLKMLPGSKKQTSNQDLPEWAYGH